MSGIKQHIQKILHAKIELSLLLKILSTILVVYVLVLAYRQGAIAPLFVNGKPITFGDIISGFRYHEPGNVLDQVILEKVVEYEAQKRNIVVTAEEVEAEITRLQNTATENGKTLYQLYKDSGQTTADIDRNARVHLTIIKILEQDTTITEENIDQFIHTHPDLYPYKDREDIRQEVKKILLHEAVNTKYDTWAKEAKAHSSIEYGVILPKQNYLP